MEYKLLDKILIGAIILIALYHVSILNITTVDQIMFFYIIMLEMIGIAFEYY